MGPTALNVRMIGGGVRCCSEFFYLRLIEINTEADALAACRGKPLLLARTIELKHSP